MKKHLLNRSIIWLVIFLFAPLVTSAATYSQGTIYVEYDKTTTVTLPDYLIDEYNNYGAVPYSGGGTLSWSVSNSSLIIEGTDHFSCRIRPRSGSTFPNYVNLTASFLSWHGTTLMETVAEWIVKLKTEEKIHANCISINHYSLYLGLGEKKQKQLIATVFPEESEDKTVSWTSSNENVATVSNDGVVTAIAEGFATITCEACDKANNAKTFCEVTVTEDDPVEQQYVYNDGKGVKEVCNSRFHTLIVKEDGTLWACGANTIGQLGDGTKVPRFSPVFIMDNVATVATGISGNSDATTSFVVKTNGDLWAWGYNYYGQLGDGSNGSKATKNAPVKIMEGVSSIYAGSSTTFIIKYDGSLWGCGNNSSYRLGDGTETNRNTPIKILDNVQSVVNGGGHVLAVTADGDLWTWGENEYGEVGDGTTTKRKSPVKIMENVTSIAAGNDHSMALKNDGTLWTWGRNNDGQLGDGTTTDRQIPIKITDNVSSIASGTVHSLFIKNDGSLWACGYNKYGQLGDGSYKDQSNPVKVMEDVAYIAPSTTVWTTIIKKDGSLWTWGGNLDGITLGDGTSKDTKRCDPTKILDDVNRVVSNYSCTFIIMKDKSLWAYGSNYYGQLGDGTKDNRYLPVELIKAVPTMIINNIRTEVKSNTHIFNLSGLHLATPKKGIIIRGGKKFIVR